MEGLENISNSKDVVYANNLPITSNDEIGDLDDGLDVGAELDDFDDVDE